MRKYIFGLASAITIIATTLIPIGNAAQAVQQDFQPTQVVSLIQYHACAIDQSGTLNCWGDNGYGRTSVPTDLGKVTSVATGIGHTCAITVNQDLRCWGNNWYGQTSVPSDLGKVQKIVAAGYATCGIKVDQTAFCLGRIGSSNPGVPNNLGTVKDISLGNYACAVKTTDVLTCWGNGSSWAPSENGNIANSWNPNPLYSVANVYAGDTNVCAVHLNGGLDCWGSWYAGALTPPADLGVVKSLALGNGFTCAVNQISKVRCWGTGDVDGNASYWGWTIPPADLYATQISANGFGACASSITGELSCWGQNNYGRLSPPAGIAVAMLAQSNGPVPVVSGATNVGSTLTADASASSSSVSYQWLRDSAAIEGATSSTYQLTSADYGHQITLSRTNAVTGYLPSTQTSSAVTVTAGTQTLTPQPTLKGDPNVGSTLTAVPGRWDQGVSFSYLWLADGVAIADALSSKYVVRPEDLNHSISFQLTASKTGYESVTKNSESLAIVKNKFTRLVKPVVSGITSVGSTLSSAFTAMSFGATYSYQWLRNGIAIDSATSRKYSLTVSDLDAQISFKVCGSKEFFESSCLVSDLSSAIVPGELSKRPAVRLAFTATKVGATIKAVPGNWQPDVTLTYQWLRDGSAIDSEKSLTHQLVAADRGHTLSFQVVAKKFGYNDVIVISKEKTIP